MIAASVSAAAVSAMIWSRPQPSLSDFAQVWAAANALLHGQNPYDVVGPGRSFEWRYPLLYPLPAVLVAVPLAWLPLRVVDPLFVGLSTALLVWALTKYRTNTPQLLVLASVPFILSLQLSQWSPILVGAALTPWAGILLACKPSTAVPLLAAFPRLRTIALITLSWGLAIVLWPSWLFDWLSALPSATHMVPAILLPGGVVTLAALLRWRRADARLLMAMACVPHTLGLYDCVPLYLLVRRWWEGAALCVLSVAAYVGWQLSGWQTFSEYQIWAARWAVWLMYLPCTLLVLTRPNVWTTDARVGAPEP